jgi:hypothetical protein
VEDDFLKALGHFVRHGGVVPKGDFGDVRVVILFGEGRGEVARDFEKIGSGPSRDEPIPLDGGGFLRESDGAFGEALVAHQEEYVEGDSHIAADDFIGQKGADV